MPAISHPATCRTFRTSGGSAPPYIVLWLDLNTPHTRDAAKLGKLFEFVHFCLSRAPARSVAVVWMPDHARTTNLDLECHTILTELSKVKLETTAIQCATRRAQLRAPTPFSY